MSKTNVRQNEQRKMKYIQTIKLGIMNLEWERMNLEWERMNREWSRLVNKLMSSLNRQINSKMHNSLNRQISSKMHSSTKEKCSLPLLYVRNTGVASKSQKTSNMEYFPVLVNSKSCQLLLQGYPSHEKFAGVLATSLKN